MRLGFAIALLVLVSALIFSCNSEATVCPNPAICGSDAATDVTSDTPLDSPPDASLDE